MKPTFEGKLQLSDFSLFVRQYGDSNKNLLFVHGGPDWDHSYFLTSGLPLSKDFKLTFLISGGVAFQQNLVTVKGTQ